MSAQNKGSVTMIMNRLKRHMAVLLFSFILNIIMHSSVYCMHAQLNYKDLERHAKSIVCTLNAIAPSVFHSVAMLSQLPTVNGFDYTACYAACEKSCGFACDNFLDNVLIFSWVGSGLFVVSTIAGYCFYKCSSKEEPIEKNPNQ